MMSGSSPIILLKEKLANALPDEPDQPHWYGNPANGSAALKVDCKNPALPFDFRQVANVNDASFHCLEHPPLHSKTTERSEVGPRNLNAGNTVTALTAVSGLCFRQVAESPRIGCVTNAPANDNDCELPRAA